MDFATTTPREVARELTSEVLNRRASVGKTMAEEYRAMDDADLAYELGNMPITDSCDAVRYVLVSRACYGSSLHPNSRTRRPRAFTLRALFSSV